MAALTRCGRGPAAAPGPLPANEQGGRSEAARALADPVGGVQCGSQPAPPRPPPRCWVRSLQRSDTAPVNRRVRPLLGPRLVRSHGGGPQVLGSGPLPLGPSTERLAPRPVPWGRAKESRLPLSPAHADKGFSARRRAPSRGEFVPPRVGLPGPSGQGPASYGVLRHARLPKTPRGKTKRLQTGEVATLPSRSPAVPGGQRSSSDRPHVPTAMGRLAE